MAQPPIRIDYSPDACRRRGVFMVDGTDQRTLYRGTQPVKGIGNITGGR
jgi:hypothetical protein